MFYIEHGFPEPFQEFNLMRLTLQGLRRKQGQQPKQTRQPVTPALLLRLQLALRQDSVLSSHDQAMLWAAFTTAFFGFLRDSEFTGTRRGQTMTYLAAQDVQITPFEATLQLRASKTDQYRAGHTVHIHANKDPLCPVAALAWYAHIRGGNGDRKPFFRFASGRPLTRQTLASYLHCLLTALGLRAASFNTHSFRIGAATSAASAGMPGWSIRRLGQWRSSAYHGYISRLASLFAKHCNPHLRARPRGHAASH